MTPLLTYAIEKQHFADVREVSARRLSLSRKALDPRPLTRLCSPRSRSSSCERWSSSSA